MPELPTLFLLPGLMCDEAVWAHQRQALAPHAHIVIPDFRGFDSLKRMAESVLAMAPDRFSVAGHSMGGRVAFELVDMAGNRIDKFAVLDTGVHGVKPDEPKIRQPLVEAAEREGLGAVADAWILPMLHPSRHDDQKLINDIRPMLLRTSVADFKGQVQALLARNDQTPYLARIRQKVLLVAGDADTWSPPAQHAAMADQLERSVLKVVKNAGHMVTMEKPEEVSTILVEWIKGDEK